MLITVHSGYRKNKSQPGVNVAFGSGLASKMQDGGKGDDNASANDPLRIVIIGSGIAGLTAAYRLTRSEFCQGLNPQVLLLERSSRAGGAISTYELEDYTLELGPDMFQIEKPEALKLCQELGIDSEIVPTNEASRRTFIAFENQLHALPEGFQMLAPTQMAPFFNSSLLTMGGKMRMAMDFFIPKKTTDEDESLAQFVRRRFGQEALERIAQPMVSGVYTADPELLSLRATMPRFLEMEQKYNSVIRGLMSEKKPEQNGDAGCRYSSFVSLKRGLGSLVERLTAALPGDCLHYQCPVVAIEKGTRGKRFDVVVASGTIVPTDAVIVASPAHSAAEMLNSLNTETASMLRRIQYASCAVLNLIYNRSDIPHELDGFGFVVPAVEKKTIIACSFASVKFPGRCPEEKAVLRVFVGGALQHDVFELTDEQIECLMWEDLHTYLGLKSVPLLSLITRYPRSMPQYHIGHTELVNSIRTSISQYESLRLCGNAYEGVGIPDCIRSGQKAAEQIIEALKKEPSLSGGSPS